MKERMLQLNFSFNGSAAEYQAALRPLVQEFAEVPGLRWKIWLLDEAEKAAGGIYLFEDNAAVQHFVDSELAAGVFNHPKLSNISVKIFGVIEDLTAITRGPLEAEIEA